MYKILSLILLIGLFSCNEVGGSREKCYKVRSVDNNVTKIVSLDSAYVYGDTLTLPTDSTHATRYVIVKRAD